MGEHFGGLEGVRDFPRTHEFEKSDQKDAVSKIRVEVVDGKLLGRQNGVAPVCEGVFLDIDPFVDDVVVAEVQRRLVRRVFHVFSNS